ncbi:MAG TPA: PAS domain S-box protein, partial [Candidatus Melainabacteria bacterium]|nr:PAS domain S-box protein [Candidatus Melainabacteria bacterium]
MRRPRLSLSTKVLALVLVPLVLQLATLFWVARLENEAEVLLLESIHAKKISDAINVLSQDVYDFIGEFGRDNPQRQVKTGDEKLQVFHRRHELHYQQLKDTVQRDAELYECVVASEQSAYKTFALIRRLEELPEDGPEQIQKLRKKLWKEVRRDVKTILGGGLLQHAAQQKRIAEVDAMEQARLRELSKQLMILIAVIDTVIAIAVAIYLTRTIAHRLSILNENSLRLAADVPLHSPLGGNDEIATVDKTFHNMAVSMKEAAKKERAIIDNARDFICSVDSNGKFSAANPASQAVLGRTPESLLGTYFADYVADGRDNVLQIFSDLRTQGDSSAIELRMKREDGSIVYVLLSAHFSKEEDTTFCVMHDISERRKAEILKQEVMAMVTHDLRTPLSTLRHIFSFLETGKHGELDDKGKDFVQAGGRNVDRLLTLVNDLLDVEKADSGQMHLEKTKVSLNECFDACLSSLSVFAESKSVNLDFEETDLIVIGDEERIDRILNNLVGNAIKFSPSGGKVTLSAHKETEKDRQFAVICVEDEGDGIPEENLENIFEKFHQVERRSD